MPAANSDDESSLDGEHDDEATGSIVPLNSTRSPERRGGRPSLKLGNPFTLPTKTRKSPV